MDEKLKKKYLDTLTKAKQEDSGCSQQYIDHLQAIVDEKEPIFISHQRHNWDRIDQMSIMSRSKNKSLLDTCEHHDFSEQMDILNSMSLFAADWKCTCCGGRVTNNEKYWYEEGLKHGGK